jgi:hypothetical protein
VAVVVPPFVKINPLIGPQWRADRARFLVSNGKNPERFDDTYVRTYRKILIRQKIGGAAAAYMTNPQGYVAVSINDFPDSEWRDIIQAKLLTKEDFSEIAEWIGTEEGVIDFFEKVFFNVRGRTENRGWIIKAILGTPDDRASTNELRTITDSQRAVLYRLFAYYGGSEALEAALTGLMPSSLPSAKKDVEKWYDKALEQVLRTKAMQAARMMEVNKFNIMQVLELAVTGSREQYAATAGTHASFDDFAEKVTGVMGGWSMSERGFSQKSEVEKKMVAGAVEPRVQERLEVLNGQDPTTLAYDEARVDKNRIHIQEQEAVS